LSSPPARASVKDWRPAVETDEFSRTASEEAAKYFGWLANLATIDLAAFSALTRQQLSGNPTGPDLLADLRNMDYIVA
jgi:hypothetical protein